MMYSKDPMRVVRSPIFALFLALLMLLPGGAVARTQYYCPMMGLIVASCCDETDSVAQVPSSLQKLQVADCCQRLSSSSRSASLGTREALRGVALGALLSAATQPVQLKAPSEPCSTCSQSTQAPLAIGPPLFVMHCALLS
jgi:hypothetical protein